MFQRLALPTPVSISNGIWFGMKEVERPAPVLVAALHHGLMASLTRLSGLISAFRR